jgi:hypothetical protein
MSENHMPLMLRSEVYAILACSEYCISEGIVNRAISICSDSRAALLALKSYYNAEILFRNWLCLTEFDWCRSLDTVISMRIRRPNHLQRRDQVLHLWGRSFVCRWHLQVSGGGRWSGFLKSHCAS